MTLTLPKAIEESLSPADAALHLAIGLYVGREVSMGQAASIAGVPYVTFMRELGKRKIALNYSAEDLEADLRAVDELAKR